MRTFLTCLLLTSLLFSACNSSEDKTPDESTPNANTSQPASSPGTTSDPVGATKANVKISLQTDTIKVVGRTPVVSLDDLTSKYLQPCNQWVLSEAQIIEVLRMAQPATQDELSKSYTTAPCDMTGELRINGRLYKYRVNAGSFITLIGDEGTLNFACGGEQCGKYFLVGKR